MAQSLRKPFKDKLFYLDLRNYKTHEEMQKNLKKLGAKIESFLSRDINYVVTDREGLKPKIDVWTPITPKSIAFDSPSPVHYCDNTPSVLFDTPIHMSSSHNQTKKPVMSRGLTLVQKAKLYMHTGTDLLDICSEWKIRVIHIQKMVAFLSKLRLLPVKKSNENQVSKLAVKQRTLMQENSIQPCIKVEDCKSMYKPQIKTFSKSWKHSFDKRFLQLVETQQIKGVVKTPNILRENQSCNIQQLQNNRLPPTKIKSRLPQGPNRTIQMNCKENVPREKNYPNRNYAKSSRPAHDKHKAVSKQRYCEICYTTFVDLHEHIQGKYHRRFQHNPDNFKKISAIISTLPNIEDFLASNKCDMEKESDEDSLTSDDIPTEPLYYGQLNNVQVTKDEQNTEEYALNDNDIILASCSSDKKQANYPYLEANEQLSKHSDSRSTSVEIPYSSWKKRMSTPYCTELVADNTPKHGLEDFLGGNLDNPKRLQLTALLRGIQMSAKRILESPPTTPALDYTAFLKYGKKSNESLPSPNASFATECSTYSSIQTPLTKTAETSTTSNSVVRAFPFTNFGFGWEGPVNMTPAHRQSNDCVSVPLQPPAYIEGVFESSSNSGAEMELKLKSNVENICKSFGSDHENTALDLSIGKSENNDQEGYSRDMPYLVPERHVQGIQMEVGLKC